MKPRYAGNAVRTMLSEKRRILTGIGMAIAVLTVAFLLGRVGHSKPPQAKDIEYVPDAWTSVDQIEPAEDVSRFKQSLASIARGRYEDAVPVIKELANDGVVEAQATLGSLYAEGRGVVKDREEAIKWHRKAAAYYRQEANSGDAKAQYQLGLLCLEGVGFDRGEGRMWIVRAARNGHPEAQFKLANMQLKSSAVPNQEHIKWLEEAARNGYAPAQYKLSVYFAEGLGVPKNPLRAKYWMMRAAKQGYRQQEQIEQVPLDP
jgi:TPR repeat protein